MGQAEHVQERATTRVIKRYSNRKLYDTQASSYVTLLDISEMVRAGEQVQVIDNATKEDKTDVTLALIISEELKANPRDIPVAVLKALVRSRGERLAHHVKEGPLGRLLGTEEARVASGGSTDPGAELREGEAELDEEAMDAGDREKTTRWFRATLEECQHVLDERIRAVLPQWAGFLQQERRLEELTRRVEELEKCIGSGAGTADRPKSASRE